jgi:hypothetical protein
MSKATKPKKVLKVLKELDTVWHVESTLVFKSQNEKKVTGRYVDGEFIELDDTALELCEEWGFKYDQELYDQLYGEQSEKNSVKEEEIGTTTAAAETEAVVPVEEHIINTKDVAVVKNNTIDTENIINKFKLSMDEFSNTYKSNVNTLEEKVSALETKLQNKIQELEQMTEKYDIIKKKFDTMKQIFA